MRSRRALLTLASSVLGFGSLTFAACGGDDITFGPGDGGGDGTVASDAASEASLVPYDGAQGPAVPRVPVRSETVSTRVDVAGLMFAAGEMQISGEPFAEKFAGRNLGNYDRTYLPTDQYVIDPNGQHPKPVTDLFGFSTAVESYEYSKYHMNMVAQQTGAGLSLGNGPLVAGRPEATLILRLRGRMQELLTNAGADIGGIAIVPAPLANTQNPLGFGGLWPNFAPFRSFDPTIAPDSQVVRSCSFAGGYGGIPTVGQMLPEFECSYNTLHLPDRNAQVERVLTPRVLGLATWKESLWGIDFVGRVHDSQDQPVDDVAPGDRALVGTVANSVKGTSPSTAWAGTYIGSTPLEGMWGVTMVAEMDNLAELLVTSLLTRDGTTLGGFPNRADALAYDYASPLAWFPTAVAVTEDNVALFPTVTSMSIASATSRSEDLAALLLGNSMFFGMTDARNVGIGQQLGFQVTFDGNPFPADNGLADGENTAHDRALAILRIAFVDLDRMHADPTLGVITDTANVSGAAVTRDPVVSTTSLAHVVIALRQTLLTLNGAISQYGSADPDPHADVDGILNGAAIHPSGDAGVPPLFSERVRSVFLTNAQFVRDVLTTADGRVSNGASIAAGQATVLPGVTTLESQAAAVRALTEGFLVTGDVSFRTRAQAVSRRLGTTFYSAAARLFRGLEAGPNEVHMTPERFAWLQSALRETHKVLHVPGDPLIGRDVLEDRIARINKLFLNGWDDLDGDQKVSVPKECLLGRLQMGEQALTGELGRNDQGGITIDRDQDCVFEIDMSRNASVLAGDVFFHSP